MQPSGNRTLLQHLTCPSSMRCLYNIQMVPWGPCGLQHEQGLLLQPRMLTPDKRLRLCMGGDVDLAHPCGACQPAGMTNGP